MFRKRSNPLWVCDKGVTRVKTPRTGSRKARNLVRDGWVSNQHGAWAMMLVPILVGSIESGLAWLQLLLLVSWLSAFFFFSAFTLWIKVVATARKRAIARGITSPMEIWSPRVRRRQARYRPALITYGLFAGIGALALVALRPALLVWAPAIAVCFAVALHQMWVSKDRSFLARASAIVASQLMAPIAFSLGAHPDDWRRLWVSTVVLTLYFVGTIPYVKTLIRERGNDRWIRISLIYHGTLALVCTVGALLGWLTWWLPALWVLLLARAAAYPLLSQKQQKPLRPALIGFSEFAVSAAVVLILVLPHALVYWQ